MKKKYKLLAAFLCLVFALGLIALSLSSCNGTTDNEVSTVLTNSSSTADDDSESDATSETDTNYTPTSLDESILYYADIEVENYGTITVLLDQSEAPITAANFVALAEEGFYDGLTFWRIYDGFVIQGGDPNGDGTGGSENTIVGEFSYNGYTNSLSHTRGAISMARLNDYNSASSQFFIVHEDATASLDGMYAAFGYVTEGMDIVDAICKSAEPIDSNGTVAAEDQPVITSVTIRKVENSTSESTEESFVDDSSSVDEESVETSSESTEDSTSVDESSAEEPSEE